MLRIASKHKFWVTLYNQLLKFPFAGSNLLMFSMALMISLSDFAEVEHTETHADMSFGALITTADFGADFFDADILEPFVWGATGAARSQW